ncbi:hypothetical protein NRB20_62760 [Nocardia sp. RB20]|uniref:DUF397 domain-containing protein n=1 Tax=Nocardia macrotermitis TaxID=2585198 RepID=A0A7K0DC11_9NOCA|nr:hypothetical protein [Nocardia macrotermitis]
MEVALGVDHVRIRDSKYDGDPAAQPIVSVASADWQAVLDLVLSGNSGEVDGVCITLASAGGASITATGVALEYNAAEWDAFAKGVADGQFDPHG